MSDENLDRQVQRLARHSEANATLRSLGVAASTAQRFQLGIKAPYRSRMDDQIIEGALSFPIHGADGIRLARFSFLNLEGVTSNAPRPDGWGVGSPISYWSVPASSSLNLIVAPDPLTLWLAQQARDADMAQHRLFLTQSHPGDLPFEWHDPSFWREWPHVTILRDGNADTSMVATIAALSGRPMRILPPPLGAGTWAIALRDGLTAEHLDAMISDAPIHGTAETGDADFLAHADRNGGGDGLLDIEDLDLGDLPYDPLELSHAFVGGNLYYPFRVEERSHQSVSGVVGGKKILVQGYAVRVLRSDGAVLTIDELPAPRDAQPSEKILVLSDGTRIRRRPSPSDFSSWRFPSIVRYAKADACARHRLHRPLPELVSAIEANLRATVLLPDADAYAIAATYVLLSYVYPIFDAIPLLLLHGTKGSGKTELGNAIANHSCNGVVVGQSSAAGIARLVDELQGVLVFDDLEKIASTAGASSDLMQLLKVGYKRAASTKPIVDRSGKVVTLNFFGPKVVTNTKGVDPVLATRMITIPTMAIDAMDDDAADLLGTDPLEVSELRDELHCWGLANAARLHARYAELPRAGDRRVEIEAPLRVIAGQAGNAFAARLDRALRKTHEAAGEVDLGQIVLDLVAGSAGGGWLSMPQLQLEVALSGGGERSPESLGRMLVEEGFRRDGEPVRRRLHGMLSRIMPILARETTGEPEAALGFCRDKTCGDCRYRDVCGNMFPQLRRAKIKA